MISVKIGKVRSLNKPAKPIIIALGEGMKYDGTLLPNTIEAVNTSVALFKAGIADAILFSAGKAFKFRDRLKYKEALRMKDRAIEIGMDEKHILTETDSVDTPTNAYFTKLLVTKKLPYARKIILVAPNSHMGRSIFLFKMIFGPGYKIIPKTSKNRFSKPELKIVKECERISMKLSKLYFKEYNFSPGDDKKFKRIMKDKYLIYNKNSKVTKQQAALFDRLIKLRKMQIKVE